MCLTRWKWFWQLIYCNKKKHLSSEESTGMSDKLTTIKGTADEKAGDSIALSWGFNWVESAASHHWDILIWTIHFGYERARAIPSVHSAWSITHLIGHPIGRGGIDFALQHIMMLLPGILVILNNLETMVWLVLNVLTMVLHACNMDADKNISWGV